MPMHPFMGFRVALLAGFILLVVASSAAADQPPVLGQENTFSGDSSGYVVVRLPERVRWRDVEVRAEGPGNLRAVAFYSDADEPWQGAMWGWVGPVDGSGYPQLSSGTSDPDPGTYRLYLFTDGSPVTIRMTIPALRGALDLAPRVLIPVLSGTGPWQQVDNDPGKVTAGRAIWLESQDLAIAWGHFVFGKDQRGQYHSCWKPAAKAESTSGEPGPFSKADCPDGQSVVPASPLLWTTTGTIDYANVSYGLSDRQRDNLPIGLPGRYAFGGVAEVASGPPPSVTGYVWRFSLNSRPVAPAAEPPVAPPAPPPVPALMRTQLTVSRAATVVSVRLRCAGDRACTGWARLDRGASTSYTIAPGRTRSVRLRLPFRGRDSLGRGRKVTMKLSLTSGGTVRRAVSLRVSPRRARPETN